MLSSGTPCKRRKSLAAGSGKKMQPGQRPATAQKRLRYPNTTKKRVIYAFCGLPALGRHFIADGLHATVGRGGAKHRGASAQT
ncbi:hypothetical protein AOC04_06130 [Pseudomonas versuta]|nr:hypothetical protein AOC04_06130 [Pseudomonas versuta]